MKSMKRFTKVLCLFFFLMVLACLANADQQFSLKSGHDILSIKHELKRSYEMGHAFLKKHQNPDGSWSNPGYPAITGLVTYAFLTSPAYIDSNLNSSSEKPEFIQKALDFIVSNAHENGAIYKEGLPNYNTAICINALVAANDPKYHPYIIKGRHFLASLQMDKGEKGVADNKFDGGIGYGSKDHSDMDNTHMALEALMNSRFVESDAQLELYKDLKGLQKKSLNWDAALKFIERCQNLPQYNDQAWASDDEKNKGGFVYYPGNSKAGEETLPDGKVAIKSYGTTTYAGLLSFIYAKLEKDDPRVQAAYGWLKNNYTLDENPGMGKQGLYFYYHTMAKSLTVYGEDFLVTTNGKQIDWRKELTIRLINVQKKDGSWINEAARWWENDPMLVSAYALISLNMITPKL